MFATAMSAAVLLIVMAGAAGGQQCRADFDSSGAVEINELITAVNEALAGCNGNGNATPTRRVNTPTRTPTEAPAATCPYRFNQAVDSDRFCSYTGQLRSNCSPFSVDTGWITNGTTVIAIAVDSAGDSLAVEGRRTNPTSATVSSLSFGPDFDEEFSATGTISLPAGGGLRFTFNAGGNCGTYTHDGSFVRLNGSSGAQAVGLGELRAAFSREVSGGPAQGARPSTGDAARALLRAMNGGADSR